MGICGNVFETFTTYLPKVFSKPQTRVIKATCPGCGKEFDVQVEQQVSGAVTGFSASVSDGGILSQCPWK